MKIAFVLPFVLAVSVSAQTPQALSVPQPQAYGTTSEGVFTIGPDDIRVISDLENSNFTYMASFRLPGGSLITRAEVLVCDFLGGNQASFTISRTNGLTSEAVLSDTRSSLSTCRSVEVPVATANATVSPLLAYGIKYETASASQVAIPTAQLFRIYYRRQVSDAPAAATFTDVPVGDPFHRFVEALVAAGITSGCGGGKFCPDAPLTRKQMAVFLSVALGLHSLD